MEYKPQYLSLLKDSLEKALPSDFKIILDDEVYYSDLKCLNRYLSIIDRKSVRCDMVVRRRYTAEVYSSFPWVVFIIRGANEQLCDFLQRLAEIRRTQAGWIVEIDLYRAEARVHSRGCNMVGLNLGETLRLSEIGVAFTLPIFAETTTANIMLPSLPNNCKETEVAEKPADKISTGKTSGNRSRRRAKA